MTDKSIVLDILVLCEDGTQADVEMQADRRPAWRSRCMFYWAKVYSSQLTPGLPYTTLKPVKVVAGDLPERNALAAAVLHVLHARAIPVTEETRAAILACGDRARLEGWVQRAVSVLRAEDLLGEAG